jgi:hypothetical protein
MVKRHPFRPESGYVDDKVGTGYDEYPKFPLETLADQAATVRTARILLASLLRELGYGTVLIQFDIIWQSSQRGRLHTGKLLRGRRTRYYYVETTSTGWDIGEVPELMKTKPARI